MERNTIENIGLMLDCSRGAVPTVDTLKELIDLLSAMGYNRLELYTEDTYEIEGRPFFRIHARTVQRGRDQDGRCICQGQRNRACAVYSGLGAFRTHISLG